MELPFAAIHQLCTPMLGRLDALPEPQQGALGVALGLSRGDAPDRFLVALAVLSLLSAVAEVLDAEGLRCAAGLARTTSDSSNWTVPNSAQREDIVATTSSPLERHLQESPDKDPLTGHSRLEHSCEKKRETQVCTAPAEAGPKPDLRRARAVARPGRPAWPAISWSAPTNAAAGTSAATASRSASAAATSTTSRRLSTAALRAPSR
jgi:hypothetical protein